MTRDTDAKKALLAPIQALSEDFVPCVDYHMHTNWTDGAETAAAMLARAQSEGLDAVLFSEHARHTSEDWFFKFAEEIRGLPQTPCRALVGVEVKVNDFEGGIDTTPAIINVCDLVMASVHRFPGEKGGEAAEFAAVPIEQAVETELRLALAVLDNPSVDILGHPFGVSIRRFGQAPSEDQFRQIIEKAARTGVAFEINCRYHDQPWQLWRWCKEAGAMISLGSNAHSLEEVGRITRVLQGRSE